MMRMQEKQPQKGLPTEFEDDATSKAPYSVKCSSMTGEVLQINGLDFFKHVLKDKNTLTQLSLNLRGRFTTIKTNHENRHDEFKFHNVQGKEVDSMIDSDSERYISDDEEELKEQ